MIARVDRVDLAVNGSPSGDIGLAQEGFGCVRDTLQVRQGLCSTVHGSLRRMSSCRVDNGAAMLATYIQRRLSGFWSGKACQWVGGVPNRMRAKNDLDRRHRGCSGTDKGRETSNEGWFLASSVRTSSAWSVQGAALASVLGVPPFADIVFCHIDSIIVNSRSFQTAMCIFLTSLVDRKATYLQ